MKKAFTLVELIIVLAVVAIIVIFSIGQYGNVTTDARMAKVKNDLKVVRDSVIQYVAKTEKVPINSTGNGVNMSDFKMSENEYIVVNFDLLTQKVDMDDGESFEPFLTTLPTSSKYINSITKNDKKEEPSFIYVMDNKANVYLAEGEEDELTGHFVERKIYETPKADIMDKKFKMLYDGDKPILKEYEVSYDGPSGEIIKPTPGPGPNPPDGGGETGGGGTDTDASSKSIIFSVSNKTIAGFNIFIKSDTYSFDDINSMSVRVSAGNTNRDVNMSTVNGTTTMGRTNVRDFNYFSGDYNCEVFIDKERERESLGVFVINIDRDIPFVKVNKSAQNFDKQRVIEFSVEVDDKETTSGIEQIEYKINGSEWQTYTKPFSISKVGYYEVSARATDKFGNISDVAMTSVNDYTNAQVYLYKTSKGVDLEAGIYIADEDLLWSMGYEDNEPVNFNFKPNHLGQVNGGQFKTKEDSYSGENSRYIPATIGGFGNHYEAPDTSGDYAYASIPGGKFFNDSHKSEKLAATTRVKTSVSAVRLSFLSNFVYARKFGYHGCSVAEPALVGSKILKVDSFGNLKIRSRISTDEDENIVGPFTQNDNDVVRMFENQDGKFIELKRPLEKNIPANFPLRGRPPIQIFSNGLVTYKTIPDSWTLIGAMMTINNSNLYTLDGLSMTINEYMGTWAPTYTDDIRLGYAPKISVYKDGVRFNTDADKYRTSYSDVNTPDKDKPVIDAVKVDFSSGWYDIRVMSEDKGTSYEYYMEAESKSGNVYTSSVTKTTSVSGIDYYEYILDEKPTYTPILAKWTQSKDRLISVYLPKASKQYIHIRAGDKAGNISDVKTFQVK